LIAAEAEISLALIKIKAQEISLAEMFLPSCGGKIGEVPQ
jgi:hypothetical protein